MPTEIAAVIMAGGLGTRMRSQLPKHLHPLLGKRLVDWVIDAARELEPDRLVVVLPHRIATFQHRDQQRGPRGLDGEQDADLAVAGCGRPKLYQAVRSEA